MTKDSVSAEYTKLKTLLDYMSFISASLEGILETIPASIQGNSSNLEALANMEQALKTTRIGLVKMVRVVGKV